jgi:uncharacterized protein YcbK (DUF882 family)
MMLTPHFALAEFACRDGSCVPDGLLDNVRHLAEQLEILRGRIQRPIVIVSGYRSPTHNAKVKGAKSSRHLTAEAADIRVAGMTPIAVRSAVESMIQHGDLKIGGVGLYSTWLHVDTRTKTARWRG